MMKKLWNNKRIITIAWLLCLCFLFEDTRCAYAVTYMPGVEKDMTNASYWCNAYYKNTSGGETTLSAFDKLQSITAASFENRDTYMTDLKQANDTLDGVRLSKNLASSVKEEISGYVGKSLTASGSTVTEEYIQDVIENAENPETANRLLTIGTKLERVPDSELKSTVNEDIAGAKGVVPGTNRSAYNNHVVYLPVRKPDGFYKKQISLISEHESVYEGIVPLTTKNIVSIALNSLGNTYGWGGMLHSNDCSGYVRDVYACFGLDMARNTNWQRKMPIKKYTFTLPAADASEEEKNKSDAEKKTLLNLLPPGSVLYFSGHEMLFLGKKDDDYYVISAVSTIMNPASSERQRVRGVIINNLNTKRANGNTWLRSLTDMTVPYYTPDQEIPVIAAQATPAPSDPVASADPTASTAPAATASPAADTPSPKKPSADKIAVGKKFKVLVIKSKKIEKVGKKIFSKKIKKITVKTYASQKKKYKKMFEKSKNGVKIQITKTK